MVQKSKVLVVDDDDGIRQSLFETLAALGFAVGAVSSGEEALACLPVTNYDAVLLDINMPGMGGIEACRRISSSFPRCPVLMLSVRDDEDDKVRALELGADDYVTKPFQIRELTARLRSAIRRSKIPARPATSVYTIGGIHLDAERHRMEKNGEEVRLSPKEFGVLEYLMAHAGRPVPHQRLLSSIWGPEYGDEREYLRVLVNQLRKKIEDDPSNPTYILTDSYIGYRFRDE